MYLSRLKRYDSQLHFVVNLTEERALKQAKDFDSEISRGKYRGPLHGIPWGAKDLLAVKGYPTTWGAGLYENQTFDYESPVVTRLDEAGRDSRRQAHPRLAGPGQSLVEGIHAQSVDPRAAAPGASGSSAGPASATAAGCVGFSIGSETNGSITSPSRTCGVSGFRPSFGRVPRTGAMALSWTTDKLGPICRSAEDCALVFDAIQGPDGVDYSVKAYPFNWNAQHEALVAQDRLHQGELRSPTARWHDDAQRRGDELPQGARRTRRQARGDRRADAELRLSGFHHSEFRMRRRLRAGYAQQPDQGARELQQLAEHLPHGAVHSRPSTTSTPTVCAFARCSRCGICSPSTTSSSRRRRTRRSPTSPARRRSSCRPASPSPQGRGGAAVAAAEDAAARTRGHGARGSTRPRRRPPQVPLPTGMYIMGPIFQDEKNLVVAHAFQGATDFHKKHPPQFA